MGDFREGVTVFVPTNGAFERLDQGLASALRGGELDNELRYRCWVITTFIVFTRRRNGNLARKEPGVAVEKSS